MAVNIEFLQLSGMEKIFLDSNCKDKKEIDTLTALKGERVSYQIIYIMSGEYFKHPVKIKAEHDNRIKTELREVLNVPAQLPARAEDNDGFYERTAPGLYPDILNPIKDNEIYANENCHSLYVTCRIPEDMEAGVYTVKTVFSYNEETVVKTINIKVLDYILPKQKITYTQWFHTDCIADYYGLEVFSNEHWQMIEKFIETAAKTGINMILTPVFTPPLDTEIGYERTTVQLTDVCYKNNTYTFGFDKLKKWIEICKKYGIEKFEISHLFTQWGTGKAPKIMVDTENGTEKRFGWHTDALGAEYKAFLDAFLPALVQFLKSEGVYDNTYFHVSDEPEYERDYKTYKAEYEMVSKIIPPKKIMDAMGDYRFCEEGLSKKPVVVTSSAEKFIEHGFDDIWVYYCCLPVNGKYSNRLMAMPLGRTRIMGIQMYKYNVDGFLHWGYNFYNSRLSKRAVNPFMVTDADEDFPAGDSFSVYPGEDGALESLRSEAFFAGLQDNAACRLLESCIGREETVKLIESDGEITFNKYPYSNEGITGIRERINQKLEGILKQ